MLYFLGNAKNQTFQNTIFRKTNNLLILTYI